MSSSAVWLNAFCGSVLNQSGRPRTAEIGRGRIPSSSGGQRKTMLCWALSANFDSPSAVLNQPFVMGILAKEPHNGSARGDASYFKGLAVISRRTTLVGGSNHDHGTLLIGVIVPKT